jgi:DNA repair protein RecO (recombination protein O)
MTPHATPRVFRSEALVLKAFDLGEADRILTLYTPTHGKVRAVAKGVRRTKSRMSGHVDLFSHCTLLLAHGRQLDIVTQADTVEAFPRLREDLWRSSWAYYVAELVDGFTVEEQANYPLFALAARTFGRLSELRDVELAVRLFEIEFLSLVGYRPQLARCIGCEEELLPAGNGFSVRLGGVLCPTCRALDPLAISLPPESLKLLRNLQRDAEAVLRLREVPMDAMRDVGRITQEFVASKLESRPRSLGVIERLRAEMPPEIAAPSQ